MNNHFVFTAFAFCVLSLSFAETAQAQGQRSYISPTGGDNRPCTRSQPCRSFDGALAKTDEGGEIIALETGTYDSTTITKAITLAAAPGADVAIKVATGNAVSVNAGSRVVLRGLKLTGPGKHVPGSYGVAINIEPPHCCISVFVEDSVITDFDRGLSVDLGVASRFIVSDVVLQGNNFGMFVSVAGTETQGASVTRSRIEGNNVGIVSASLASVTVSESVAAGNGVGFQTVNNGNLDLTNSVATKNGTGVEIQSGTIRIASSTVVGNLKGLDTGGGLISSMGNNMIINNGIDINGANHFTTFLSK